MSGESEAMKGGDDFKLSQQGDKGHEGHDPFAEVRAGAGDRVAKAADTTAESDLEKEAKNPTEGFANSTARFGEKLANASPEVKNLIAADAKATADFYGQSVEKEFGKEAGQLATNFNMNLMTGKSVDNVPQEAASLKA